MYDKDIIERFRKAAIASVADACDKVVPGRQCIMDHSMRPRVKERKIVGPAATLLFEKGMADGPSQHLLDTLDKAEDGEIAVCVLPDADMNVALWGGLMTAGAYVNGMEGAVLNCGVRDLAEIRKDFSDFEIFSCSVHSASIITRYIITDHNVPVECAGVLVNPGDLIVGDIDGVICVPKEHAEEILEIVEDIETMEAQETKWIRELGSFGDALAKFSRY